MDNDPKHAQPEGGDKRCESGSVDSVEGRIEKGVATGADSSDGGSCGIQSIAGNTTNVSKVSNADNSSNTSNAKNTSSAATNDETRKRPRYSIVNPAFGSSSDTTKRTLQEKISALWERFAEREGVGPGSVAARKAMQVMEGAPKRRKLVPVKAKIPMSTTRRIMRMDDDVCQMISKDATVIMGKIVELFVMDLAVRAAHVTLGEERQVVKRSDIAAGANTNIMFDFLCDMFPIKEYSAARRAYNPGSEKTPLLPRKRFQAASSPSHEPYVTILPQDPQESQTKKPEAEEETPIQTLQQQQLSSLYGNPSFYSISDIATSIIDQMSENLARCNSHPPAEPQPSGFPVLLNDIPPPTSSSSSLPHPQSQQFDHSSGFPTLWEQDHRVEYPYRVGIPSECPPPTDADIEEEENDLYDDEDEDDDSYSDSGSSYSDSDSSSESSESGSSYSTSGSSESDGEYPK